MSIFRRPIGGFVPVTAPCFALAVLLGAVFTPAAGWSATRDAQVKAPTPIAAFGGRSTRPPFSSLYNFTGAADGWLPNGALIEDDSGTLYGTAYFGGTTAGSCNPNGCGVVFAFDPATATETVLHTFGGMPGDGAFPRGGLLRDSAGNLYGTTSNGGPTNHGEVFKLDTEGTETMLYNFCQLSNCADGNIPDATLVEDASGNLYGVTNYGGNSNAVCGGSGSGCGVVFKVDTSGHETVLHAFAGVPSDGGHPYLASLLRQGSVFYGDTETGGIVSSDCSAGCGIVFKLTANGKETVLHAFRGGKKDGCGPIASLIRDSAGNLYGTTQSCGGTGNGIIFKIDSSGSESVIHDFKGAPKDGALPGGAVLLDSAGNLHGTTQTGGTAGGDGTTFIFEASGRERLVHSFDGSDGTYPLGSLIEGNSGLYYGVTNGGGVYESGTIFSVR